jgi:ribosome-associated protein
LKKRASNKESSPESSKEKACALLMAALSKKAFSPVLMRLAGLTSLTDYFLIVSARSAKHVKAVAEAIALEARVRKIPRFSREGVTQGHWALLDYGDVIIHVFQPEFREFYDLEGLWIEAPREVFTGDIAREIEAAAEVDEAPDEEED